MMRRGFILAAVFAGCLAARGEESVVRFSNKDRLSGSLRALEEDRLMWDSPMLEKPVPFWLKNVLDLTMPARVPDYEADHEATLTLARGDSLRGQLAGVTDGFVELDTWYAGRLRFKREWVRELRIDEKPRFFYRGPDGLEGWTQPEKEPTWRFENGAFVSDAPGGISRELTDAEEFRIAFDIAWRGSFRFSLLLFTDDVSTVRPQHGYELIFNQRNVQFRRCGGDWIGNTPDAAEFLENEKARIEIRASKRSGTLCFYLDGRIVEVWKDTGAADPKFGRGIHFVTQNPMPLRISRIEVSSWDGVVEETPEGGGGRFRRFDALEEEEESVGPEVPEEGRMMLRNGDSLTGEVMAVDGGVITLKTPFDEVKLPVVRLRNLALKSVELEEPKRERGDVRAWFPDGTSLVFRLEAVDEETITGYSQNFGTATFQRAAFHRIDFNIYDRKMEELRQSGEW